MSTIGARIVELCGILSDYAERRGSQHDPQSLSPGGAVSTKPDRSTRWYCEVDDEFTELQNLIGLAPRSDHKLVLSSPRVRSALPALHQLRAAYEYDKELAEAVAILDSEDSSSRITRHVQQESYWAVGSDLHRALAGCRNIAVAGSGPMPLTALAIASVLGARVTCIERMDEAVRLARQVIACFGYADRTECVRAEITDVQELDAYDAVVGTVLLGVNSQGSTYNRKLVIVGGLLNRMRPGTRLVYRDPHGLGRLLYPQMNLSGSQHINVLRLVPPMDQSRPYRSAIVIARQKGHHEHDAGRSSVSLHP